MKNENRGLLAAIVNGPNAKRAFKGLSPTMRTTVDEMLNGHVPDKNIETTLNRTIKHVQP